MKKENRPLISFIVPVYNCENYIERCINSILNQEYNNIEVIIIDDGSTDQSKKIVDNFEKIDKRIKVIHQQNSGVSVARNVGIDKANGKFITFIDSDDFIENNYASYLLGLIDGNDIQISTTNAINKFFGKEEKKKDPNFIDSKRYISRDEAIETLLYYNIDVYPFNKLFNKDFLNKYSLRFNNSLSYGEDFEFILKCFTYINKIVIGNEKIYNYRENNPNSAMSKFNKKMIDDFIISQENIRKILAKENSKIIKACKYANWHTYCDCLNTMIGCDKHYENKKIYSKLKAVCRWDSIYCINAPISIKDKMKGFMYLISPYFTAKLIKQIGKRRFK